MNDDLRMRVVRTWLISRGYIDEAAEQLAPQLLAELDAADPLRQARGDAVEALLCEWHNGARWKDEMSTHCINGQREVATRALNSALAVMGRNPRVALDALSLILPLAKGYAARNPTKANQADINFACEVLANLDGASMAVMGRSEAPDPPFPAWGPEMAAALDGLLLAAIEFHGFGEAGTELVRLHNAAFPDPARDGSP